MSWFYVDDGFYDHPKLGRIPPRLRLAAIGLWTVAGTWSRKKLTGGHIPRFQVEYLGGTQKLAKALVDCELWKRDGDDYCFHEWSLWQETIEDVLAKREANNQRQREWRAQRDRKRGGSVSTGQKAIAARDKRPDKHVGHAVSHSVTPALVTGVSLGDPSPSPSPVLSLRERGEERDPPPLVEREPGEPECPPDVRVRLRHLVRNKFEKRFHELTGNTPSWTHGNVEKCDVISKWLETNHGHDPRAALDRLLENFFANPRAEDQSFPLGWLATSPAEYFAPSRARKVRSSGFAPPAPAESFTDPKADPDDLFGPIAQEGYRG